MIKLKKLLNEDVSDTVIAKILQLCEDAWDDGWNQSDGRFEGHAAKYFDNWKAKKAFKLQLIKKLIDKS